MLANALYLLALSLLSPWILYRRVRHGRYRRGWRQKLLGISGRDSKILLDGAKQRGCIWIHAVSVGEVNLLGGILDRLRQHHPGLPIVVSSSTDTGYDLAVEKFGVNHVFFCPLDFSWAVRRTLRHLEPRVLVLAELELWPNLIKITRKRGADVIVINGRLSDRSAAGYQRFDWITKSIFAALSKVECQDRVSANNFASCGTPQSRIDISGSLKFDNAPQSRECVEVQSRCRWAGVDPWQRVWVFGSTQEGEEQLALEVYTRLRVDYPELRLIVVPRHPERFDRVAHLIEQAGFTVHRRSSGESMQHQTWNADRVILIDTIGELRHWWGVGQISTVGGSFGDRGGQNMLEPAGYGNAISFGPNTRNFADISQRLLDADGAVRVKNAAELRVFVQRCLTEVAAADSLGRSAKQVIEQHRGATDRTVAAIENLLGRSYEAGRKAA